MSKKQVCLFSWDYMVNHMKIKIKIKKKDWKIKMKNRSHRYYINRPRSKHGHKYSKI